MTDQDTQHPRDDDRNDELADSPVPDPEATDDQDAEGDPEAD